MGEKTHRTAVVVIPPEEVWAPIQEIRGKYDRQIRRWMPHITLLYPFRKKEEFEALQGQLAPLCRQIEPLDVELTEFRWFAHRGSSFTFWVAPEPVEKLNALQEALQQVTPDCNDVQQFSGGFTPHLSLGQARGQRKLQEIVTSLQQKWEPIRFQVSEISLIWRNEPPDDVFRVDRTLALGAAG
jgi:2'-5' RNA ligase